MDITVTDKKTTQTKERIQFRNEDKDVLTSTNVPFSDFLQEKINEISTNSMEQLQDVDFQYDSISMDIKDALFFINLTQEGQFSVNTSINGDFQNLLKTELSQNMLTQKTVGISNQLTMLIEKAQSTQKPVRISFDNDVSVILKIDKQGKLSAEFIPGNLEVENYLMTNISSLKQRFDEQNLPYNSLSYRQNSRNNKNKSKNKGES